MILPPPDYRRSIGVYALQGRRDQMEDFATAVAFPGPGTAPSPAIFCGVFDGHGGRRASQFVSERLPLRLRRTLGALTALTPSALCAAVRTAVLEVDAEFCDTARKEGWLDGTTASFVVALPGARGFVLGNVGDSRAIRCSKSGGAVPLHDIHSPDRPAERARIQSAGGTVVDVFGASRLNGALSLSRAIGDVVFRPFGLIAEPDVEFFSITDDDEYLVLATDGLWDAMTDEQAHLEVRNTIDCEGSCAQTAAENLVRRAYAMNSLDNISAIVMAVREMFRPHEEA